MTPPKAIVAIKSCIKYEPRRAACLQTWLPELDWADFFFITGNPTPGMGGPTITDTLACNVSDEFANIAPKIRCACMYALDNNAEHLFVCDDDTYVRSDRLLQSGFQKHDYVGFLRVGPLGYNGDVPYAQGSAYWLSARAMELIILSPEMREGVIDDGAVGRALVDKVGFVHDWRYEPGPFWANRRPLPQNNIITTHKCLPDEMPRAHDPWRKK